MLRKGAAPGTVLDSIGRAGFDPGTEWGSVLLSTMDNTLRRLPSITVGDTDPGDVFDWVAQWAGFAVDTSDGLGEHTIDGTGDQPAVLI